MNNTEIKKIVEDIESFTDKENACVLLYQYGGGSDEAAIRGNRDGYLLFATSMLRASIEQNSNFTDEDIELESIVSDESDYFFTLFEKNEDFVLPLTQEIQKESFSDKLYEYSLFAFLLSIPIFWVIGIVSIIKWLFS